MRTLLQYANAKTSKGEKLGVRTSVLYLAPAYESGVMNTCPMATEECQRACLFTAGRGAFQQVRRARIAKTLWLSDDPEGFKAQLRKDITKLERYAHRHGMRPAVRINGTSDVPKLAMEMAREFPGVQFYDYTKIPQPWKRTLPNYHLTFSHSGHNLEDCLDALKRGINVAVVFSTRKGQPLPETWNGFRVVDGDQHDCRFLDPIGVVIGLRAKGAAKTQSSVFVVLAA
jgi:hypothetical protein